ncbi:MAG: tRNA guanosine(34) transglycosylase Tgt [archaeon]
MFKLISQDNKSKSEARYGVLKTKTCKIETPFFMPVATLGTGKFISSDDYIRMKVDAIICNAFILSLKPGLDVLEKIGIHRFMDFDKVIFTDCGGFQISREFFEKISKHGIHFKSPFNNEKHLITPKKIMEIQGKIGSDVAMALDDMSPYKASYKEASNSLINTHKWGEECLKHKNKNQLLFGIIQGNFYKDLRIKSARFMTSLDFDGIAIGGLAIGEPLEEMHKIISYVKPYLPKEKIRYLMGVGSPRELVKCIEQGIDCFDSVFPTQNARHNTLFTSSGKLFIDKSRYRHDFNPIDKECNCFVCKNFTRAYIYHLSNINEPIGKRYKSYHNLYFLQELMKRIRISIKENEFYKVKKEIFKMY